MEFSVKRFFINIDMGFCVVYNYKQQGKEFYGKKGRLGTIVNTEYSERMGEQIRHARIREICPRETVSEKAEISRAAL